MWGVVCGGRDATGVGGRRAAEGGLRGDLPPARSNPRRSPRRRRSSFRRHLPASATLIHLSYRHLRFIGSDFVLNIRLEENHMAFANLHL